MEKVKKVGIREEVKVDEEKEPASVDKQSDGGPQIDSPVVSGPPVTFATEEDAALASTIAGAKAVDEEEWEKTYLDIKSRGNYFDLVRNMYPFKLPPVCEQMQEGRQRKYAWWGKDSIDSKCDPSSIIHWTPVNRSNHPVLPSSAFNKNGGLCREGLYLCYMPWRMYEARCDIQKEVNRMRYEEHHQDIFDKGNEFADHYRPRPGAGGGVVMGEGEIEHPQEAYKEVGEYAE